MVNQVTTHGLSGQYVTAMALPNNLSNSGLHEEASNKQRGHLVQGHVKFTPS